MAFSAKTSDYDYTIENVSGVVGVKDGVEYPISKEDYDRENPHMEHCDSGCTECSFVQDKETLFTFFVPRELKEKAGNKPVFVGKFTMPKWVGHSGFYVFMCKECGIVCLDYPHGYTNYGLMFLRCKNCEGKPPLKVNEEKAIYKMENVHIPKPTIKERIRDLKNVVERIEDKGVRVIVPGVDMSVDRGSRNNVWSIGLFLLALLVLVIFFITSPNLRPF